MGGGGRGKMGVLEEPTQTSPHTYSNNVSLDDGGDDIDGKLQHPVNVALELGSCALGEGRRG